MNAAPLLDDFDTRLVDADSSAMVSPLAVVGATGEWRGKPTRFPVVLSAGVVVREFARVHAGCINATVIGEHTVLLSGSYVGHDTMIGASCDVAPNATIGGCVIIGDRVKIGMNATIRPHVVIGDDVRIGAGAVVVNDVPSGATVVGNPAKRISTAPQYIRGKNLETLQRVLDESQGSV